METLKIMLVDDHDLFLEGVKNLLAQRSDFEIVAKARNGNVALENLKIYPCDVLVLDLNMPELDGVSTAKLVQENYPSVKILIVTEEGDFDKIYLLRKMKVDGYIMKTATFNEMSVAIETIAAGGEYFSQDVKQIFFDNLTNAAETIHLTKREKEVLRWVVKGCDPQSIADRLNISKYTVIQHQKNLRSKTGCSKVNELIIWGMENGFGTT